METMTAEATIEFATANTVYRITPLGFGVMEVRRGPRDAFAAPETVGCQRFIADEVSVHPDYEGGSVLEGRRVVFSKAGKAQCVTSGGDSRAYINLPWGSYEAMAAAVAEIDESRRARRMA